MGKRYFLLASIMAVVLVAAGCTIGQQSAPTTTTNDTPAPASGASDADEAEVMEDGGVMADEVEAMDDGDSMEDDGDTTEDDGEAMMGKAVSFNLSGTNFAFDVKEIRVKKGDTVTINFSSADGFHDWTIDEFSAATEQVSTGGNTSVTFTADQVGTFEYYCSVGSHRALGMVGNLIVE